MLANELHPEWGHHHLLREHNDIFLMCHFILTNWSRTWLTDLSTHRLFMITLLHIICVIDVENAWSALGDEKIFFFVHVSLEITWGHISILVIPGNWKRSRNENDRRHPIFPVLSCCSGCVECISNKKLGGHSWFWRVMAYVWFPSNCLFSVMPH